MIYSQRDVETFRFSMGVLALATMLVGMVIVVGKIQDPYASLPLVVAAFVSAGLLILVTQLLLPKTAGTAGATVPSRYRGPVEGWRPGSE